MDENQGGKILNELDANRQALTAPDADRRQSALEPAIAQGGDQRVDFARALRAENIR